MAAARMINVRRARTNVNISGPNAGDFDAEGVRAELQRILASDAFSNAPVLSHFLGYVVEHWIREGNAPLKEYAIGVDVFHRGADFDPRVDTIVRVHARRLRKRLLQYYESQGRADPVRVTLPKGHYHAEVALWARAQNEPAEPRVQSGSAVVESGVREELPAGRETPAPPKWWVGRVGAAAGLVVVLIALIAGVAHWHSGYGRRAARRPAAISAAPAPARQAVQMPPPTLSELPSLYASIPADSVAVLPFANDSDNAEQQYFIDGLSEELISDLVQVDGLKVTGWYSSFKFRNTHDSPAQIGAMLGVANLIQGSVFQQGSRIRITVTLIRAKDGVAVWSHGYDEPLTDVFAIETTIAHTVATALRVKLLGSAIISGDKPPSGNIAAYRLMLEGRAIARRQTEPDDRQAIALLGEAVRLDPDYAYAWGALCGVEINLGINYLTDEAARQHAYAQARLAADKQQALAPDSVWTLLQQGALQTLDDNPMGTLAEHRRAYALAPNNGDAMAFLAYALETVGQLRPASDLLRKAIATDPLRADWYSSLGVVLMDQGQFAAAAQANRRALLLEPDYAGLHAGLAEIDILRGDAAAALRNAGEETDPGLKAWMLVLAEQIGPEHKRASAAARNYVAKYGKHRPYRIADLYALRGQPDETFEWLRRAETQHAPYLIYSLLSDPFLRPYQHDPRFARLCKQTGLPPPGHQLSDAASVSGR